MLHPTEWAEREDRPSVMWIHGLDALEHVLKGDIEMSAFKHKSPSTGMLRELRRAMENNDYDYDSYNKALESQDIHDDVWKELPSDMGDLDIDSYLDREEYIFEEPYKRKELKPAMNILFEFAINYHERQGEEVQRRHEKIYPMVLKAQAEGVPTRVIAVCPIQIGEMTEMLRIYVVIKDWEDPIFPGIWGALRNNSTANAFLNTIMDYIVGTHDGGNGRCIPYNITEDMPEDDDVVLIEGDKVKFDR